MARIELDAPNAVPPTTKTEVSAIKALFRGTASKSQQLKAVNWIVKGLCGIGKSSWRPDRSGTDMLEGRRFVGIHLVNVADQPISKLKVEDDDD